MYSFVPNFYGSTTFSMLVQIPDTNPTSLLLSGFTKKAEALSEVWTSDQFPSSVWPIANVDKEFKMLFEEVVNGVPVSVEYDALAHYGVDGKIIITCDHSTQTDKMFSCNPFHIEFAR